jgi:hypothetical protein
MGLEKVISLGVALAILAATTGQLPRVTRAVQIAQLKLLKESQASKWPKPPSLKGIRYADSMFRRDKTHVSAHKSTAY